MSCALRNVWAKTPFPQFNQNLEIFRNLYLVLRHVEISIENAYTLLSRSKVITINLFLLFRVTFSIDECQCVTSDVGSSSDFSFKIFYSYSRI